MDIAEAESCLIDDRDDEMYDNQVSGKYTRVTHKYEGSDKEQIYLIQEGHEVDGEYWAFLGPNEVFYNRHGLRLKREGTSKDKYNQNKKFEYITNIKHNGNTMMWPIYLPEDVENMKVMCVMDANEGVDFDLTLSVDGSESKVFERDDDIEDYTYCAEVSNLEAGLHYVEAGITGKRSRKSAGDFYYLKLVADEEIHVVRERWRPLAAHCGFTAKNAFRRDAFIMETSKIPSLSCFSPMNSPFGYWGVIMSANGTSTGVNMSMWSYGRNQKPPPVYQWSRILAIGDPKARIKEFHHEGHGVKIEGLKLWKSNKSKRYVTFLKYKEETGYLPDGVFGYIYRYTTYFWDEGILEWRLYGVGQKYSRTKVRELPLSSFVEVPGPAEVQRTNHVTRTVKYKGYARNRKNKKWFPINSIVPRPPYSSTHTNCEWGVTEDNRFFMSAGGLEQRTRASIPKSFAMNPEPNTPIYMRPEKLDKLKGEVLFPEIHSHTVEDSTTSPGKVLKFKIDIRDEAERNGVYVYSGKSDGLTLVRLWESFHKISNVKNGESEIKIPYVSKHKYYRIFVRSNKNQLWSLYTYKVQ